MKNSSLVITAGGNGKRFSQHQKKQYFLLFGKPIIYWTIKRFVEYNKISDIIIVLPKGNFIQKTQELQSYFPNTRLKFCLGGSTRQISVFNGLKICELDTQQVLIHDGVRPFISDDLIDKLLEVCSKNGSAVPGSKVVHTLKKISRDKIESTVNREDLVQVYTPQVFDYQAVFELHKKAMHDQITFTDDSSLYEKYGFETTFVSCSNENIKITEKSDIGLAEFLMKKYFEIIDD